MINELLTRIRTRRFDANQTSEGVDDRCCRRTHNAAMESVERDIHELRLKYAIDEIRDAEPIDLSLKRELTGGV